MKKLLKISYRGFYNGFDPSRMPQDYFYEFVMSHGYDIIVDDKEPDLVFYSVFGNPPTNSEYTSNPLLVACSFEPYEVQGNFDFCFGYGSNAYRFPLWLTYIIWDKTNLNTYYKLKDDPYVGQGCHHTPGYFVKAHNGLENNPMFISNILKRHLNNKPKTKFCNFTYTNPVESRIKFFTLLKNYKQVHSTGKLFNNTGYHMISKSLELTDYKFTIAFENSILPGYNTEKLLEPLCAGSVPIYLGDKLCKTDFNPKAFIYANDFDNLLDLFKFVIQVDKDESMYNKYINEPVFGDNIDDILDRPKKLFDEIYKRLVEKKPKFKIEHI